MNESTNITLLDSRQHPCCYPELLDDKARSGVHLILVNENDGKAAQQESSDDSAAH